MLLTLVCAVPVFGTGCADDSQPRWEGENITLTSDDGVEPCGGTVAFLDRYVGEVHRYWAESAPPEEFDAAIELRHGSDGVNGGVAHIPRGTAWAGVQNALLHEVNHLILGSLDGASVPVFFEGTVEAIAPRDPTSLWDQFLDQPETFAFTTTAELEPFHYTRMSKLVRSLTQRFGIEKVRLAYQRASPDATGEEIEAVFVEVFGDSVYDAFDEFMGTEQCGLQVWECSDAVVSVLNLPVSVEHGVGCADDPDLFGAVRGQPDENWAPVRRFLVDLPQDSTLRIDVTDNAYVLRERCLSSCDERDPFDRLTYAPSALSDNTVFDVPVPAGRQMLLVGARDLAKPFAARIELVE
jgi:hypothetical protein